MSDSRLRVGVIGLGAIAQLHHLPNLASLEGEYDVRALCDLSRGLAETLAREHPSARVVEDWEAVCDDPDLDAVCILSSGSHGPIVRRALGASKHVFVEKPLCTTRREASELAGMARAAGRVVRVGYMKRHEPVVATLADRIEGLHGLRAVDLRIWHPGEDLQVGHARIRRAAVDADLVAELKREDAALTAEAVGRVPGGLEFLYRHVLLESVVHYLPVVRALTGRRIEAVLHAEAWPFGAEAVPGGWSSRDRLPSLHATFALEGDARLLLTWTWLPVYPEYHEDITVLADDGRAHLTLPPPYLTEARAAGTFETGSAASRSRTSWQGDHRSAFRRELVDFHAAVAAGESGEAEALEAGADIGLLQSVTSLVGTTAGVAVGGEAADAETASLDDANAAPDP